MKNIIKIFSAGLIISLATQSFAQTTTPLSTDDKTPIATQSTAPINSTVKPATTQEPTKGSNGNEQQFAESHPKFDKLEDNHPKEARHIYNHRNELMAKGMTGKDVYQNREHIKHHEEKRAQEKKEGQKPAGATTPQPQGTSTPNPQQQ